MPKVITIRQKNCTGTAKEIADVTTRLEQAGTSERIKSQP
jgi:hypothetical protein